MDKDKELSDNMFDELWSRILENSKFCSLENDKFASELNTIKTNWDTNFSKQIINITKEV